MSKIGPEEFVMRAIVALKDPKYHGLHVVYSGFNRAFRHYFKDEGFDPRVVVDQMVEQGKIEKAIARGGAKIYALGEGPKKRSTLPEVLKKMHLE